MHKEFLESKEADLKSNAQISVSAEVLQKPQDPPKAPPKTEWATEPPKTLEMTDELLEIIKQMRHCSLHVPQKDPPHVVAATAVSVPH